MHDACTFDSIKLPTPSYLRQNFNISFKLQRFFKVESKKHAHKPWVFPRRQGWGFFVMLEFGVSFQEAAAAPQLFRRRKMLIGSKKRSHAVEVRGSDTCWIGISLPWNVFDVHKNLAYYSRCCGQLFKRHQLVIDCAEPLSKEKREIKVVAFRLHRTRSSLCIEKSSKEGSETRIKYSCRLLSMQLKRAISL